MKTQIKYWRGNNKTRGSGEPVSLKSNTGEELIKLEAQVSLYRSNQILARN